VAGREYIKIHHKVATAIGSIASALRCPVWLQLL
jgi:hypothetical protein